MNSNKRTRNHALLKKLIFHSHEFTFTKRTINKYLTKKTVLGLRIYMTTRCYSPEYWSSRVKNTSLHGVTYCENTV